MRQSYGKFMQEYGATDEGIEIHTTENGVVLFVVTDVLKPIEEMQGKKFLITKSNYKQIFDALAKALNDTGICQLQTRDLI